jgi:hypothetical protein
VPNPFTLGDASAEAIMRLRKNAVDRQRLSLRGTATVPFRTPRTCTACAWAVGRVFRKSSAEERVQMAKTVADQFADLPSLRSAVG